MFPSPDWGELIESVILVPEVDGDLFVSIPRLGRVDRKADMLKVIDINPIDRFHPQIGES